MRLITFLLCGSLFLSAQMDHKNSSKSSTDQISHAQRLLVVTTPGWNSVDGTMQRYERQSGKWTKVGEVAPVVVGKSGMGWDPVLLAERKQSGDGPVKHEGDGRSPAGVFEVGNVFGFAESGPSGRKYLPLTGATECVDDVKSDHYAHIVDRNAVPKVNWDSSEKMREIEVYKLGMVVNYNLAKTVPGNGSCIFLHIWKSAGRGTAGCTATEAVHLEELVKWIGNEKAVLVQMPTAEYQRVKKGWALP